MRILARTINNKALQVSLSLSAYLNGPVSNTLNEEIDPFYVLESFLPFDYTSHEDEELLRELERACLLAVRSEDELAYVHPIQIKIDTQDLNDFKILYYHTHPQSPIIA